MSLCLLCQLGIAGLLLFVGVSLGLSARPRLENPFSRFTRIFAIALSACLFVLYVTETVGSGLTLETACDWIALRAHRLVEMCGTLF